MSEEYISRSAAMNDLRQVCVHAEDEAEVLRAIAAIPAADVAPVRHGRWIEQPPDFDLCGVAYYQCSECGKEQQTPSNYCQFCGAKMDGGKDE